MAGGEAGAREVMAHRFFANLDWKEGASLAWDPPPVLLDEPPPILDGEGQPYLLCECCTERGPPQTHLIVFFLRNPVQTLDSYLQANIFRQAWRRRRAGGQPRLCRPRTSGRTSGAEAARPSLTGGRLPR